MGTEYIIKVSNKSGETRKYLFFNAAPTPSDTLGQVYTNVWLSSPGVPTGNGVATFDVKVDDFAVCGTTPEPVGNNVLVSTSDYAPVNLASATVPGTAPTLAIVDGGPQFTSTTGTTSTANSFAIQTKAFNPIQYNTVYCGYGKYDNLNDVVPVAVWKAEPSNLYVITPVVKYYVGTGDYEPGTTVDITTLGATVGIDFTTAGAGETVANVTQNEDGTYSAPVFSFPPG